MRKVAKYLQVGDTYIPIKFRKPDEVYQLTENVFQILYDKGKPTERIEEVTLETLKTVGNLTDEV